MRLDNQATGKINKSEGDCRKLSLSVDSVMAVEVKYSTAIPTYFKEQICWEAIQGNELNMDLII